MALDVERLVDLVKSLKSSIYSLHSTAVEYGERSVTS
jgi:hypothetical protein